MFACLSLTLLLTQPSTFQRYTFCFLNTWSSLIFCLHTYLWFSSLFAFISLFLGNRVYSQYSALSILLSGRKELVLSTHTIINEFTWTLDFLYKIKQLFCFRKESALKICTWWISAKNMQAIGRICVPEPKINCQKYSWENPTESSSKCTKVLMTSCSSRKESGGKKRWIY